jgi:hypothetical protein
MSAEDALLKVHAELLAMLDAKIADMPEWRAFRGVNAELLQLGRRKPIDRAAGTRPPANLPKKTYAGKQTYAVLAEQALDTAKEPLPTQDMLKFIGERKKLENPDKARINMVSALSHDDRFHSVPWNGGRAWWWSNKPVPNGDARDPYHYE